MKERRWHDHSVKTKSYIPFTVFSGPLTLILEKGEVWINDGLGWVWSGERGADVNILNNELCTQTCKGHF